MLKNINKITDSITKSDIGRCRFMNLKLSGGEKLINLGIQSGGITEYPAPYKLMRNGFEKPYHAVILLITEGELELETEHADYELSPGDFVYVASHVARRIELKAGFERYREVYFLIDFESGKDIFRHNDIVVHKSKFWQEICNSVKAYTTESEEKSAIRSLHAELIVRYLRREFASIKSPVESDYLQRLFKLREKIRMNPGFQWKVNDLAKEMHVSSPHLFRLTELYLQLKPMELVTNIRMEKAKELLSFTDHPLETIANELGYASAYSFSHVFNKKNGIRPGRYRRNSNK